MGSASAVTTYDCPSAQPDMEGARPIGLLSGTASEVRIAFFKKEALQALDWRGRFPGAEATHVFRFGARCETARCGHYDGLSCQLGKRVKEDLQPVVDHLPSCLLRPTCRWHAEHGAEVCLRCPQVATMVPGDGRLAEIACGATALEA